MGTCRKTEKIIYILKSEMQARFPFFREKYVPSPSHRTRGEPGGVCRRIRSDAGMRHDFRMPDTSSCRRPQCDAPQGLSGAICGRGRVNGRVMPFRASEGVFRRIRPHCRSRGQKECVRRRFSGGRRLFVRFRTDWRIRRSRSSWSRRHGRVPPTYPCRRWSSSRAYRWSTDGRGGRPSGRCCNRRRPR